MTMEGTAGPRPRAAARAAAVIPPRGPRPAPPPRRADQRGRRRPWPTGRLLAADALALSGAAALLRPPAFPPACAALAAFATLLALHASRGLYRPSPMATALEELPRLFVHAAVAWCVADALFAGDGAAAWRWLPALALAQTLAAGAARGAVYAVARRAARRRPRAALVVGTGPSAQRLAAALARHPEYGLRPVGLVGPVPRRLPDAAALPVLSAAGQVSGVLLREDVGHVLFTRAPRESQLRLFRARGCTMWRVGADPALAGPRAGHLWGFACELLAPPPPRRLGRRAKRALDVVVALAALLAAAPLLLLCALAVRLAQGPGVLFRQVRVGEDGRRFVMLKFRTLTPADEGEAATRWSIADDRRLTTVGRLLRRTSLDELPQLWNVLRGDMSLVGPRPERPHFVERFSRLHPGYADRHRMPAGLTGLAQVSGLRGDTSIEDRIRFDNLYIETWSLWRDVCIVVRTTATCFRRGGS
ncbi:exopolysaccharide biosynthesis polyprenyl glycosylphosphotransferase [Streptomyces hoynatensis]|uniref:Exopolysaccharide biosynthesis polyprenyl glycosylphosphotransferase n=1 Tax=Streptomyces hoynatensis TaxID=1141874 RepID=A0A3A9YPY2_9ACTN|nr:exopolysaccharide biosynthesis polyprenyl glycosylphosphotransferase [Streptomyces hoynatensis]RKN38040.1 exopolysaccharide biosynthesis polyprenyl glycosylphosphotransferase [Streptomyces hoynatensis]